MAFRALEFAPVGSRHLVNGCNLGIIDSHGINAVVNLMTGQTGEIAILPRNFTLLDECLHLFNDLLMGRDVMERGSGMTELAQIVYVENKPGLFGRRVFKMAKIAPHILVGA